MEIQGSSAIAKQAAKGYFRANKKLPLLPYYDELEEYLIHELDRIEHGLVAASLVDDIPALLEYLQQCKHFFVEYGMRATQERILKILKLAYLLFIQENNDKDVIIEAGNLIVTIKDSSRLSHRDMILDWRPVFNLYYETCYGKIHHVVESDLTDAVHKLKAFYDPKEIKEIWKKLEELISPHNWKMNAFAKLCSKFLPVHYSSQEQKEFGAGYWFDTIWNLYTKVENPDAWGDKWRPDTILFSLPYFSPDFKDMSPHYDFLFTRILRAFGPDKGEAKKLFTYAYWIGYLLGGPHSCQSHLEKLITHLEVHLHPASKATNEGDILEFLEKLLEAVRLRIHNERIKKHKRAGGQVSEEYYLKDEDLEKLVMCLVQPTLFALFNSSSSHSETACKMLNVLLGLQPGLVLPLFLEQTYNALHAVDEPHRLTNTLNALVMMIYSLSSDNHVHKKVEIVEDFPEKINLIRNLTGSQALREEEKKWYEENQATLSLRHHLIHLLEALIAAVDINDSTKTQLSLHNIILIYYLIPNVDSSDCISFHNDLTEDEKELCRLTAKLPELADLLLHKMLLFCHSMESVSRVGSLSDNRTKTAKQEKTLIRYYEKLSGALLNNSSEKITKILVDKLFKFITTHEFQSQVATDMLTKILEEAVLSRQEMFTQFAEYILKHLKNILTAEVRQDKELSHTALWFINLAGALFNCSASTFHSNQDICIEILEILLSCECKIAHEKAIVALRDAVHLLTGSYILCEVKAKERVNRPLNSWIPIRDWAWNGQEHEISVLWHLPTDDDQKLASSLIEKFYFPALDVLQDPKADTFALLRAIRLLMKVIIGCNNVFPLPQTAFGPLINPQPSAIPKIPQKSAKFLQKTWEVTHPSGQNVKQLIVKICEKLVDRFTDKEHYHVVAQIPVLLKFVMMDAFVGQALKDSYKKRFDQEFFYTCGVMYFSKRQCIDGFNAFLMWEHFGLMDLQKQPYAPFQQRIFALMFKLAVSVYPQVRWTANRDINTLLNHYPEATEELVEKTAEVLLTPKASDEQICGALDFLVDSQLPITVVNKDRIVLWKALIQVKMLEKKEMTELSRKISAMVEKMLGFVPQLEKSPGELEKYCTEYWKELKHNDEWGQIDFQVAREKRREIVNHIEQKRLELVDVLLELDKDRTLHHTKQKLIRAMLWICQGRTANVATIQILLDKLLEKNDQVRDKCATQLAMWLRKNKPATRRRIWKCPEKTPTKHNLECGIRPDNLCIVYDSQNLPDTKEKWESTNFLTYQAGCYKWPESISLVVPASEPQLDRKPLNSQEIAIVDWFSRKENVVGWLSIILNQKKEEEGIRKSTFMLIKYLLRNFPDHPEILQNFRQEFARLIQSKARQDLRLAAEIFLGMVKGIKHRNFNELDEFWKWIAPEVDRLFDRITSEAKANWIKAIELSLQGQDPRRLFWLIEELLKGMQRPSSAFHQSIRIDLISLVRWRDNETLNRICEIAWSQIPRATLEDQRSAIAICFARSIVLDDSNMNNDYSSVAERFRVVKPDVWMARFAEKIEGEKDKENSPYLRTLYLYLVHYFNKSLSPISQGVLKILPIIVDYAMQIKQIDIHLFKNGDLILVANKVINSLGHCQLTDEMTKPTFDTISKILPQVNWKVRVTLLKLVEKLAVFNSFICDKPEARELITDIILTGLVDQQSEVRREAAHSIQYLFHLGYFNCSIIPQVSNYLSHEEHRFVHGAVLGLAAIVMAHPYTTPECILPCIERLCRLSSKKQDIQKASRDALREFRRTHRDSWKKTKRVLGAETVYMIENTIAPLYYA